jgi:GNAT superfamily N-acetyltransferase
MKLRNLPTNQYMNVKSLAYRTDLIFPAFDAEISDRGDYLVIRTPANPTFYWGNYLLFDQPPSEGDYSKWREIFSREIGNPPEVIHHAFGWDTTEIEMGVIQPFLDNGYYLEQSTVLTARAEDLIAKGSSGVTIRQLQTEDDWKQSIENQVICRDLIFSEDGYRVFRQRQAKLYRQMATQGLGTWFGAFYGDRLVGDLGIFHNHDLGRYQSIQTHPDFRRRGIAGALVYTAAQFALEQYNLEILVIVAEADSPAERLYKSIGFQFAEYQLGISKSDELTG